MNTLDMFDKIQMLTYDRRYGQLEETLEQFREREVNVDVFMTGAGNLLPASMYSRIDPPAPNVTTRVYQNHREMIKRAKVESVETLLLLEDDIQLLDGFDDLLNAAMNDIHELGIEWDILYLGPNYTWGKSKKVTERLRRIHGSVYCMQATCLNTKYKPMFDIILNLPLYEPGCTPALDFFLAQKIQPDPQYNVYGLWPVLAVQRPGESFIVGGHQDYSQFFREEGEIIT